MTLCNNLWEFAWDSWIDILLFFTIDNSYMKQKVTGVKIKSFSMVKVNW